MGKKVKENYKVEINQREDGKLLSKPKIILDDCSVKWEEIASYDDKPQYEVRGLYNDYRYIYLSEDEDVEIEDQRFRADLGCWIQYTNKELEERKNNLKKCEKELAPLLRLYNKQRIEANPKAKRYCDVHKLDYSETDYEELMEIIDSAGAKEVRVAIANDSLSNNSLSIEDITSKWAEHKQLMNSEYKKLFNLGY